MLRFAIVALAIFCVSADFMCTDISKLKLKCKLSEEEHGQQVNGEYTRSGTTVTMDTTNSAGPCVTVMHFSMPSTVEEPIHGISFDVSCASGYSGNGAFFKF